MKRCITDMGQPLTLTGHGIDGTAKSQIHIPRYGVWEFNPTRGKMEVIATSDDLDLLKTKYGPGLEVVEVKTPE